MSQGNDFANYASSAEDRGSASEDVWFVAVSSDDIKQMTIDQLDEAFRLGVITAQTAVWTEGMEAWAPLGEVADLDGDDSSGETESSAEAPPAAAAPSVSSESAPNHRRTNPGWHNPFDPPGAAPAASNGMGAPSSIFSEPAPAHNSVSMGPSSFAPVTASYAPPAPGSLSHSTGPVALNVDEDSPPIARGRRFRPERWLLAAAGVIAVGVIAFNNSDLFSGSKSVAAAEKQAAAAAIVAHPYEVPADKAGAKGAQSPERSSPERSSAEKSSADDGKDAPIGSLKGEAGEEENSEATPSAAMPEPVGKPSSSKDVASSKEALHDGFAKAFSKSPAQAKAESKHEKPAKGSKAAKASKMSHTKTPSRAASASASSKSKKPGAPKTGSAFDPLNGSLP